MATRQAHCPRCREFLTVSDGVWDCGACGFPKPPHPHVPETRSSRASAVLGIWSNVHAAFLLLAAWALRGGEVPGVVGLVFMVLLLTSVLLAVLGLVLARRASVHNDRRWRARSHRGTIGFATSLATLLVYGSIAFAFVVAVVGP